MSNQRKDWIIGIDLGTTFTSVGFFDSEKNQVEIIQNDMGQQTTPSVVTYEPNSTLVGQSALYRAWGGATNTITDAKRFIGHQWDSEEVQSILGKQSKKWPFDVIKGEGGRTVFKLNEPAIDL